MTPLVAVRDHDSDVERMFRDVYGQAVATLVRVFGDITLAEDAVQDAFVVASDRWPAQCAHRGSRASTSPGSRCQVYAAAPDGLEAGQVDDDHGCADHPGEVGEDHPTDRTPCGVTRNPCDRECESQQAELRLGKFWPVDPESAERWKRLIPS